MSFLRAFVFVLAIAMPAFALAGPPYMTDDPVPTDYQHYEIYVFSQASGGRNGVSGAYGLDFNYGATADVQLTAVLPIAYAKAAGADTVRGVGNVELAAKYRFAHAADVGWDVAFFPRVFLPAASERVGEKHFSLLLPIWLERDWDRWSTFGGGGCVINRGGESKDFCVAGWALTNQVTGQLQLGAEIVHQSADTTNGHATTQVGAGLRYDVTGSLHVLAYAGPGLQNIAQTQRYAWYTSVLFTF